MMKDYYKILGLTADCSQEDIKKAYRKLARNSHPDSCGKEDCTEFREVQEAYDAIGEKGNRNNYDRERRLEQQQYQNFPTYSSRTRKSNSAYPFSFEQYFDQIFSEFLSDNPFHHGADIFSNQMELILTKEEARQGGIIPFEFPIQQLCPTCRGKGSNMFFFCDHCNGSGSVRKIIRLKVDVPPNIQNYSQFNFLIPGYGVLNITVLIR